MVSHNRTALQNRCLDMPDIERSKNATAFLTFCTLGVYTLPTRFLLHKSNTGETRKPKQFTNNYCIWYPSYRSPSFCLRTEIIGNYNNFKLVEYGCFAAP